MGENQLFLTILKLIVALIFVLVLVYFSLRFGLAKFYATESKASRMKVIDQLYLAPKTLLILVQVGEEYFLLTFSQGQVNAIKELAKEPMALEKEKMEKQFILRTNPFFARLFSKQSYIWRKGK
ncbi:MAG TPA: flagellar biosynthetic protein FliO [Desulfotomaculum sp.]|nr:flagellar biosynthetic protein FliO [Desulfotomaculum sp.]